MSRTLIITEKPSVAREYAKILGVNVPQQGYIENNEYVISWCVGHLVTMAYPEAYDESYKEWKLDDLPFLPTTYKYEVIEKSKSQFYTLKKFMNDPDINTIYYAGDSGREGEYIGRLVRLIAGVRPGITEKRVWIDSFTESEIKRGIKEAKPLSAYDSLYDAATERAIEDYATGINFSRALSLVYGYRYNNLLHTSEWKSLSVGRVMTCVLGMVVEREREIREFKVSNFYKIGAEIENNGSKINLNWKCDKQSCVHDTNVLYNDIGFKEEREAQRFIDVLDPSLKIVKVDKVQEKKSAPLLFSLSELQSECTKRFKLSPDETLAIAQSLYEKKLTTYPRTDARVLSSAVAAEIDKNLKGLKRINEEFESYIDMIFTSESYKNIANTQYTDDSKITDHYAIIPTGDVSALNSISNAFEKAVYELIVRRFIAIFFAPATYTKVTLKAENAHGSYVEIFHASKRALDFPGYQKVYGVTDDDPDAKDSSDKTRQIVDAMADITVRSDFKAKYYMSKGETQPPKRYTSGSMVLAMENAGNYIEDPDLRAQIKGSGVGTSATRAEIISKLIRNDYIRLNRKSQVLTPSDAGEILYDIVNECLPDLLSPKITASWEKGLDQIYKGEISKEDYEAKINVYVRKGIDAIKAKQETIAVLNYTATPICQCPVCQRNVLAGRKSFYCEGNKDKTCKVVIYRDMGSLNARISDQEAKTLLAGNRITKKLTNKEGKTWPQDLIFNKSTCKIDFAPRESIETRFECLMCGEKLSDNGMALVCGCGYKFWKNMAGRTFSNKELGQLFTQRRIGIVDGFKKKDGKSFSAAVYLDEQGNPKFEFPSRYD